ncbi:hypothetical protein BCR44DRAFT_340268 [Catenaria anguillulae PL171]|uniref:OTU domain-containing protein n=1 Tax=Catenaria anguillulae PL171 TaxID=765915 RepID=A0A1Y2HKQ7_9FUNG|nr:hypothetical protein BCR44DRAFT_340268 [Catenaria anguillulae PL171]
MPPSSTNMNKTSLLTASLQKQASATSDTFPPPLQHPPPQSNPSIPRQGDASQSASAMAALVSSSVPSAASHGHQNYSAVGVASTPPPHSAMLAPSTPSSGNGSYARSKAMPVAQARRHPHMSSPISSSPFSSTPVGAGAAARNPALARVQSQDIPTGSPLTHHSNNYSHSPSARSLGGCSTPIVGGTASSLGVASVTDGNDQVLAYFADPDVEEKEAEFEEVMLMNGLAVVRVPGDGMCLYSALGVCLSQPAEQLQALAMDFIARNATYFEPFLCEDVATYVARKNQARSEMAFGNHVELLALACALRVIVYVHETDWSEAVVDPSECPVFEGRGQAGQRGLEVVRVWHHGGHYDALVPATGGGNDVGQEPGHSDRDGEAADGVNGFWDNV